MATVEINGVELYYEQTGEGDRIVLTHGAWTDGRTWQAVTERLAGRFEVVTWDRRGHSRSGDGIGAGSCRQDAFDLAGLIEHLGADPVHVVGNSAGGNVVLNLVAIRDDLVRSAAVHEPGPFGLLVDTGDPELVALVEHEKTMTAHVEELIANGEHGEAARYFVEEIAVGPGAWEQFPEELRSIIAANAKTVPDDLRDGWDAGSVDLQALAVSPVPLLISSGTNSPRLEAAAAVELSGRVPTARFEVIEGAGHIPHRTYPDEYARMLTAFFDLVTADSTVPRNRS